MKKFSFVGSIILIALSLAGCDQSTTVAPTPPIAETPVVMPPVSPVPPVPVTPPVILPPEPPVVVPPIPLPIDPPVMPPVVPPVIPPIVVPPTPVVPPVVPPIVVPPTPVVPPVVVPPAPITSTIFCGWEGGDVISPIAGNQQNLKGSVVAPMGSKVSYLDGGHGKDALDTLTNRIIANPPNVVIDASGETHFSMAINSTGFSGKTVVWGIWVTLNGQLICKAYQTHNYQ